MWGAPHFNKKDRFKFKFRVSVESVLGGHCRPCDAGAVCRRPVERESHGQTDCAGCLARRLNCARQWADPMADEEEQLEGIAAAGAAGRTRGLRGSKHFRPR